MVFAGVVLGWRVWMGYDDDEDGGHSLVLK